MIKETKLYQYLSKKGSKYVETVEKVYEKARDELPKINRVFANYTGHGIEHSINVMGYMYDLITNLEKLSDLEITCLICAALLHDVGMVATESEIEDIRKEKLNYYGRKYSVIYDTYKDDMIALQECIRPVHGERAFSHIMQMKKDMFVLPGFTNCNFQEEIAKICWAHTMDHEWLTENLAAQEIKGQHALNAQYVAMLLRIADYLDIDEKRAPMGLYELIAPVGFGDKEWKQHYIIMNEDKIRKDNIYSGYTIVLYGQCDDPRLFRKMMAYLSDLSKEVLFCSNFARKQFPPEYQIAVNPQIENHIKPKGFEISDLKLELDYKAIMNLLMGVNLYFDRKYGLRELIQNSIDACSVMREEALEMEHYQYNTYKPRISIIVDETTNRLIVMDNGTGMKLDTLKKYFLSIGKSYYKSKEFLFLGRNYHPIGTFGIGFLACFMLSDTVKVETKHFTEKEGFSIELEADSEFISMKRESSLIRESGTAIILDLNHVLTHFFQPESIRSYIKHTFLKQSVEMEFICAKEGVNDKITLLDLSQLISNGIALDQYLNGISATIQILSDEIRIYKNFSDFCPQKSKIYQYNSITRHLCYRGDIEGEELKKYIENNNVLVGNLTVKNEQIYFPLNISIMEFRGAVTLDWVSENGVEQIEISDVERRSHGFHRWTLISTEDNRFVGYGHVQSGKGKTYLHGILVEGGVRFPETMLGVKFGDLAVNIKRDDVELDISRRYLLDRERIEAAIGRAVNLYIADKIADEILRKEILNYVDKATPADNIYVKDNK